MDAQHREIVMTDPQFMDAAEQVLQTIEACCDRINDATDADIDNQRVGGMVTLKFANGSEIVVNLQKPLQEIWLASRSGGYHFRLDGPHWVDTKGQGELFRRLSTDASAQSGLALAFSAGGQSDG